MGLSQNNIGLLLVDRQHHPRQIRLCPAQRLHQFLLMGQVRPIGDHRAQGLSPLVDPHIEMPDQPPVDPFIVGGNLIPFHPQFERLPQPGGGQRLQETVLRVNHFMAPGPEKAHPRAVGHGKLDFVPIPVRRFRPVDLLHPPGPSADPLQGVLDLLPLKAQFLGIGHVPQLTSSTPGIPGAVGALAAWNRRQHLGHPAPGGGLAHLQQLNLADLSRQGPLDKDRLSLQPGPPLSRAAVSFDPKRVLFVLFRRHGHVSFLVSMSFGNSIPQGIFLEQP